MKEGDENRGHTPAQNAWCPAPPDDPNAALWASIAPPPAPSFGMKLRRRLAALSLEHLAESVRRAFPRLLSSRAKAECAVLGIKVGGTILPPSVNTAVRVPTRATGPSIEYFTSAGRRPAIQNPPSGQNGASLGEASSSASVAGRRPMYVA